NTSVRQGLNARFDIYKGPMNNDSNSANYAPALNVRKGYKPGNNACNSSLDTPVSAPPTDCSQDGGYCGLPPDNGQTNRWIGDGNWSCLNYWQRNFPSVTAPSGCTNPATIVRYDVYQAELSRNLTSTQSVGLPNSHPAAAGEVGAPSCNTQSLPAGTSDR